MIDWECTCQIWEKELIPAKFANKILKIIYKQLKFKAMENESNKKNLYTDKVEISVAALIEIKRAFSALIEDKNSYLHRVFLDDNAFHSINELTKTYANYFNEPIERWGK